MSRDAILAIFAKDAGAIRRDRQVWLPMLILPTIFAVVMPALMVGGVARSDLSSDDAQEFLSILDQMPESARAEADALPGDNARIAWYLANYFLAPFFLLVPLVAAATVSAGSFAGEKERGTLETLLFTPVDLKSVFYGKVLASAVPALALGYGAAAVATVVVNVAAWPLFGYAFFPGPSWIPLLALLIPGLTLLAICLSVFVSAKVATFQAAYQLSGLLVLPVVGLVAAQASGILFLGMGVVTAIGVGVLLVDAALVWAIFRNLDRFRLFESQVG